MQHWHHFSNSKLVMIQVQNNHTHTHTQTQVNGKIQQAGSTSIWQLLPLEEVDASEEALRLTPAAERGRVFKQFITMFVTLWKTETKVAEKWSFSSILIVNCQPCINTHHSECCVINKPEFFCFFFSKKKPEPTWDLLINFSPATFRSNYPVNLRPPQTCGCTQTTLLSMLCVWKWLYYRV